MRKPTIWVLIADGQRARLFETTGRYAPLTQALDQEFIGNALPSREINADRPGRYSSRIGGERHAMDSPTDPHRHEKREFARQLAEEMEEYHKKNRFDQLIIVAPPQTLGDIRAEMTEALKQCVRGELNKDLTKIPVLELPEYLEEVWESV